MAARLSQSTKTTASPSGPSGPSALTAQRAQKEKSIFQFILREKFLTLTVIGSVFTFAFIASLKGDIIDPLLQFVLTEENFGFMDITIREGEKMPPFQKQLELRFGNFFRELCVWLLVMTSLYVLYMYTDFPDIKEGNYKGSAIIGIDDK